MSLTHTAQQQVGQMALNQLRADIRGRVITPDDPDYEAARVNLNHSIERYPAAIVRPMDARDISQAILFARDSGMEFAVRGGGHSLAGHSTSEDGIVLDMSSLKGLDFDLKNRVAWAEAGLTAGEYTKAAADYGLVTGFGDTPSVGIGGLTLGGGVGYLVRKYGLTLDDLLAVEIVTADGHIFRVSEDNHSDLFWALRGGGGNFGVVTRFLFRLHAIDMILGGLLVLPATPEVISGFVAASDAAPEDLSSIVNIAPAPPLPFIPAEYHGQLVLMAMMVYAGDVENGQQVFAPFHALAEPIADMIQLMTYPELYNAEEPPKMHAALRSVFMDEIGTDEAQVILDYMNASSAPMKIAQIRVLGGAMARVPTDATAYAHRNRKIMAAFVALYGNPAEAATHDAWVSDFAAAMRQGAADVYVNFLGDEGEARVRDAYPTATMEKLAAVKAQYDPTNFFHMNHNIAPDGE